MRAGHSKKAMPSVWLFTDARVNDAALFAALHRLPRGAGIVFRHHALPRAARRALFDAVRIIARRRRLILLLAGPAIQAQIWGADGWHGRKCGYPARPMLHSAPVHGIAEMRSAERHGADLLFLSPLFPTRSHPDAPVLGHVRFGLLAHQARLPVIALGGVSARRAKTLAPLGASGWAAIDALS